MKKKDWSYDARRHSSRIVGSPACVTAMLTDANNLTPLCLK